MEAVVREASFPPEGGRARIARIVVVACLVLAAAWGGAVARWGGAAAKLGEGFFHHRQHFRQVLAPRTDTAPLVVWLGDSTVVTRSYPSILAPWLQERYGAETRLVAAVGMTTYNYYELMGAALDLHPTIVVLLANLRMFQTTGTGNPAAKPFGDDLASMIPTAELPRALLLPWMTRGVSLARLGLLRTLEFETAAQAVFVTAGLQSMAQARSPWSAFPPPPAPSGDVSIGLFFAGIGAQAHMYDVEITPRQPFVQMMTAAIRMATRRGVPVLVVASPIPLKFLEGFGLDRPRYDRRFARLQTIAEAAGATFVDYHAALEPESFADNLGHYTADGAALLASKLHEPVGGALATALAGREHR